MSFYCPNESPITESNYSYWGFGYIMTHLTRLLTGVWCLDLQIFNFKVDKNVDHVQK